MTEAIGGLTDVDGVIGKCGDEVCPMPRPLLVLELLLLVFVVLLLLLLEDFKAFVLFAPDELFAGFLDVVLPDELLLLLLECRVPAVELLPAGFELLTFGVVCC